MFHRLILKLKIFFLKREVSSIEEEIWSYYISLNIRSTKYFGDQIDVEKELEHFKRLKYKQKLILLRKIRELEQQIKKPVK